MAQKGRREYEDKINWRENRKCSNITYEQKQTNDKRLKDGMLVKERNHDIMNNTKAGFKLSG